MNNERTRCPVRGKTRFAPVGKLLVVALAFALEIMATRQSYCTVATQSLPEKHSDPGIASALRDRIKAGLNQNLSYMKAQNQSLYPLWPLGKINQFAIFDDKKLFYNGLFYANLSILTDVTGVRFELGPRPQLIAILGENLKSWKDVNAFLSTQNTSYRIPDSAMQSVFTGCNKIQYSDNGSNRLAILVVDISESRDFGQIDRCVFSELISAFGFETTLQSKNTISELTLLRTMYSLDEHDRDASVIVDEILRRMPAEQ